MRVLAVPGTPEAEPTFSRCDRLFSEFNEDAVSRLGMHERDPAAASAESRLRVNEGVTLLEAGGQGRIEVCDPITDVVDSGPAAGEEAADRRVSFQRLEQLDLGAAEIEMDDSCPIDQLGAARRHPEDVAIEAQGGCNALDSNAKMGDGGIHVGNI